MINILPVVLDIYNPNQTYKAKQGDAGSRYLLATITENNVIVTVPESATVNLKVRKSDLTYTYTGGVVSEGKVLVELTSQTLSVAGINYCEIEIIQNEPVALLKTIQFRLSVDATVYPDDVPISTSEFTALTEALAEVNEFKNDIAKLEENQGTMADLTTTADTLVGAINELDSEKEDKSNKVTSIDSESTDTQYPSAKLTYDQLALKEPNLPATPETPTEKFLNGNKAWAVPAHNKLTDLNTDTEYQHMSSDEKTKLTNIEGGAEVNNISDADASELTGGEETDLHKHAAADVNITDTGEYYDSTDVEGVLQEVGSELASIASHIEALADAPDNTEVGNIGTPAVTLIDNVKTIDGVEKTFKKFKFANLKGDKGDSPIKGVDYWTESDKMEIIQAVVDAMGGTLIGYVDENNVIVLVGGLEEETYTVKYEMEDESLIDIGELDLVEKHSVTNNLTNCTTSNASEEIVDGNSYSAIITANEDYVLASVTVIMGGVDITSTAVSGGTVSIASVTGDIVITAVATEEAVTPTYTNLADPTSADWQTDYRLSLSSGGTSVLAGHIVTNFIPCKMGDTLRVKGLWIVDLSDNSTGGADNCKVVTYNSDKGQIVGMYGSMGVSDQTYGAKVTVDGDIQTYTILLDSTNVQRTNSTCAYLRIDGKLMNGYTKDDVIITINEEITN